MVGMQRMQDQLDANEAENDRQSHRQVDQPFEQPADQEVQLP
jgi:hypothetical protein